jgi:hypothetical protein
MYSLWLNQTWAPIIYCTSTNTKCIAFGWTRPGLPLGICWCTIYNGSPGLVQPKAIHLVFVDLQYIMGAQVWSSQRLCIWYLLYQMYSLWLDQTWAPIICCRSTNTKCIAFGWTRPGLPLYVDNGSPGLVQPKAIHLVFVDLQHIMGAQVWSSQRLYIWYLLIYNI